MTVIRYGSHLAEFCQNFLLCGRNLSSGERTNAWRTPKTIPPDKSVFIPSQRLVLLGFIIDSVAMTITLTPEKAFSVKEACSSLLEGVTTIRDVARVIGKIISSFPGVIYGALHYRSLEHDKTRALQNCMGNFDCPMSLSEDSYRELVFQCYFPRTTIFNSHHRCISQRVFLVYPRKILSH